MLPSVNAQEGNIGARDGVLVGTGRDAEGAALLVLDKPGPTAALDASEGSVHLLAEGLEGAEVLVDGGLESFRSKINSTTNNNFGMR